LRHATLGETPGLALLAGGIEQGLFYGLLPGALVGAMLGLVYLLLATVALHVSAHRSIGWTAVALFFFGPALLLTAALARDGPYMLPALLWLTSTTAFVRARMLSRGT